MASKSNDQPEANDAIPSGSSKPEGRSQTNGKATNPNASEINTATLMTLELVQAPAQTMIVNDEQAEKELEELLRQMDEASILADGIENKVDALLADLEGMLGSLDAGDDKEEDATHNSPHDPSPNAREAASSRPNRQARA